MRLDAGEIAQYRDRGFLVRRGAFEPAPLIAEVQRGFEDAFRKSAKSKHQNEFVAGQSGRYFPLMSALCPVSISLLEIFASSAELLLGRKILPVRTKAVLYTGSTGWHVDSARAIPSVGFACYLEPLREETGALCVRPRDGSPHEVLKTDPGDVIVFDEHLEHSSRGGRDRRQWRVDFVARPTSEEEGEARAYFRDIYQPNWDGGYDVDLYPSYGEYWRSRARAEWNEGLERLGAYALAAAEEDHSRSKHG